MVRRGNRDVEAQGSWNRSSAVSTVRLRGRLIGDVTPQGSPDAVAAAAWTRAVQILVSERLRPALPSPPKLRVDLPDADEGGELVALVEASLHADSAWLDEIGEAFTDPLVAAVAVRVVDELADPLVRRQTADPLAPVIAWDHRLIVRRELAPAGWPAAEADEATRRLASALIGQGRRISAEPWRVLRRRPLPQSEPVRPTSPAPGRPSAEVSVERETPALTVAIASRNRRDRLLQVLGGLAAQRLPPERFDVVVVLDGTEDDSAEAARALDLPYGLEVVAREHSGLAATRNAGHRAARNPVVCFLDDDIIPEDGHLAAHSACHAEHGSTTVAMGPCPPVIEQHDLWSFTIAAWWEDHFRRKQQPDHVWEFRDVNDGNTSVSKQLLDDVGGYDERFAGRRQDWELGVRLLAAGATPRFAPAAIGHHHLDTSFATAAKGARREGADDVHLARRHPDTLHRLQVIDALQTLPRKRLRVSDPLRLRPAADLLQRVGSTGGWQRATGWILWRQYQLGVVDALTEGVGPPLGRPLLRTAVADLRAEHPVAGIAGCDVLELRWGSEVLTSLRTTEPGAGWDWEDLVERAAAAVEGPLAPPRASGTELLAAARELVRP